MVATLEVQTTATKSSCYEARLARVTVNGECLGEQFLAFDASDEQIYPQFCEECFLDDNLPQCDLGHLSVRRDDDYVYWFAANKTFSANLPDELCDRLWRFAIRDYE